MSGFHVPGSWQIVKSNVLTYLYQRILFLGLKEHSKLLLGYGEGWRAKKERRAVTWITALLSIVSLAYRLIALALSSIRKGIRNPPRILAQKAMCRTCQVQRYIPGVDSFWE